MVIGFLIGLPLYGKVCQQRKARYQEVRIIHSLLLTYNSQHLEDEMLINIIHRLTILGILAGCLAACEGSTAFPLTVTALPSATNTFVFPPAAPPAEILQVGSYGPYPSDQCENLRVAMEKILSTTMTVEIAAFNVPMSNEIGAACLLHTNGNGQILGINGPMIPITTQLQSLSWSEDKNYDTGNPTNMVRGFRKGSALVIITVKGQPSIESICPKDKPIDTCTLLPEQKLFDVTLAITQKVIYIPLPDDQCAAMYAMLQPVIPVPVVLETVAFTDPKTNDIGTSCRVHGLGNGNDFQNYMDSYTAILNLMETLGWSDSFRAGGPTGTLGEFVKDNHVAVVFIGWNPSPDANCPTDQPIDSCNLAPEQKLYEFSVDFAQQ